MKILALRFLIIAAAVIFGVAYFIGQPRAQESTTAPAKSEPIQPTAQDLAAVPKVVKSDAEWKAVLTPRQYAVMRGKATELACSSVLLTEHRRGVFRCAGCGAPLFGSDGKFESGTGWPSFTKPFVPGNIVTAQDHSFGMDRDEILCARGHFESLARVVLQAPR